jgi:histidine ammonia-lyase
LAIELLCAAQGVDLRAPHKPGKRLLAVHSRIRSVTSFMDEDRPLYHDIEAVRGIIDDGSLVEAAALENQP